jgi:hypothetical protein
MEKMGILKTVEKELDSIMSDSWRDNSFFFEWNEDEDNFAPKIIIAWKEIPLDKLKYNL